MMNCDICREEIKGEYIRAVPDTTEPQYGRQTVECKDICMKCWKTFQNSRRISLVEFPNSEVENEKIE